MKNIVYSVVLAAAALAALAWLARPRTQPLSAAQFVAGLPVLKPGLKLEVASLSLIKTASGESSKSLLGFDLGTTKAVVTMPARVHFSLDLSGPKPVAFERSGATLVAVFPDPEVSSVELFTGGKRALVAPGWGRLAAYSGSEVVDALERGMHQALRRDAEDERMIQWVREEARPLLEKLVDDYARKAGAVEKIIIRFRGEKSSTFYARA
jgi:hypothetical protein